MASSLALALGVSVGNADPTITATPTSGSDETIQANNITNFKWETSDSNYYQFGRNNGSTLTDKSVSLFYWVGQKDKTIFMNGNENREHLVIGAGYKNFTITTADRGIKMGNNGEKTLIVRFDDQSNKEVTLNLTAKSLVDKTEGNYALLGNLWVWGGSYRDPYTTKLTATFTGGMKGNILTEAWNLTTITFKSGNLEGNISTKNAGKNVITFEKDGSIGNIETQDSSSKNIINFQQSGTISKITTRGGINQINFNVLSSQNTKITTASNQSGSLKIESVITQNNGYTSIAKADLSSINNNGFTFSPASTHSN
ncbi:hypothetical protein, partial [Helicobacter cholecystus]|uniref:hypothetical protein n=1 Tax=Helicobacter cholecystus TaxID=45498 RepID=UPI0027399F71